jgi:hypothetical protein
MDIVQSRPRHHVTMEELVVQEDRGSAVELLWEKADKRILPGLATGEKNRGWEGLHLVSLFYRANCSIVVFRREDG